MLRLPVESDCLRAAGERWRMRGGALADSRSGHDGDVDVAKTTRAGGAVLAAPAEPLRPH